MKIQYIMPMLILPGVSIPAYAAEADHEAHHAAAQPTGTLSSGEVRKVDPDTKKITIRHGPLENLGMPPMTMVFQVADAGLLSRVKSGDKIRFQAEKSGGAFVVTHIERQ